MHILLKSFFILGILVGNANGSSKDEKTSAQPVPATSTFDEKTFSATVNALQDIENRKALIEFIKDTKALPLVLAGYSWGYNNHRSKVLGGRVYGAANFFIRLRMGRHDKAKKEKQYAISCFSQEKAWTSFIDKVRYESNKLVDFQAIESTSGLEMPFQRQSKKKK